MNDDRVRVLPASLVRVESGAIRFGTDWTGLFIRGDESHSVMMRLRRLEMLLAKHPNPEVADALGELLAYAEVIERDVIEFNGPLPSAGERRRARDEAYLDILGAGLVMIRNNATARPDLCEIEADHLHNIPSLLGETNESRHVYYLRGERGLYLRRLREIGATDFIDGQTMWYGDAWRTLAEAARVTLEE